MGRPTPPESVPLAEARAATNDLGRVRGLDALRGLAALTILVHHVATQTGATLRWREGVPHTNFTSQYTARLDVGVQIFFVLSAYLLFRPFLAALYAQSAGPSAWRFWWRRFWRIYPGYWVALFLGAALFYPTIYDWRDGLIFAALVQSYDRMRALGGLAQAWSLNVEVVLYAFLPVAALVLTVLSKRFRPALSGERPLSPIVDESRLDRLVFGFLVVCVVISYAFRLYIYGADPTWALQAVTWFPGHLDTFAIGMGLAWAAVVQDSRGRAALPSWLVWLADAPARALVGAGGCFFLVSALGLPLNLAPFEAGKAFVHHALYGLIGGLVVAPAALGPLADRVVGRVLMWRPLEWVGTVSYGVYLWHLMMVVFWIEHTGGRSFDANFWLVLLLTLGSSLVLGWLSWIVVERPTQRFAARVVASRER